MSKTKLLLSGSVLLLTVLACNSLLPTVEPSAPPAVTPGRTVVAEPTYSYPPPTWIAEPTFPSPTPKVLSEAQVPRVPPEVALTALQSGAAVIVDVRTAEEYQASHIAGAISIPVSDMVADPTIVKLDKDQWIITYCS